MNLRCNQCGAVLLAVMAAACTTSSKQPDDPYDIGRMDLQPKPAVLSSERHTGPFAAGNSISMDAMLKPLLPDPVKEVRLDTTHKIIDLAPGVKFSAWTFAAMWCRGRWCEHAWATRSDSA